MSNTTMAGACVKCGTETGAVWKKLCPTCWKNRTPDEIRVYRQAKLDKKVARLRAKAERLSNSR
jgi:NMD protein affecting ribosome stability and mRNA decay